MNTPLALPARRNLWPWFAAIVLAMVVAGDCSMVIATRFIHPTLVESHPWLDSTAIDAGKAARGRFALSGRGIHLDDLGQGRLRFTLLPAGPGIGAAQLQLYRPDGAAPDQTVAWPDTSRPLDVMVTRDGYWRAYLLDPAGDHLAATDIALGPITTQKAPP